MSYQKPRSAKPGRHQSPTKTRDMTLQTTTLQTPALQTKCEGLRFYPGYLDRGRQAALVKALREVFAAAPLFVPRMPKSGQPFTVRMSNCGPLGWLSDESGYRYVPTHPGTGRPWPPMPEALIAMWNGLARYPHPPEACLINFYGPAAKMGLHQDRDETDFDAPVVSLSLGDSCLFRVGGLKRGEPTHSFRLNSGDVVVLGGAARLAFHGVDRIYPGTSTLLAEGGRINLTLRRVTRPDITSARPRQAAAEAVHE
jgi:alkylated DNA repair protein (DNA oxidative demethylase)